MRASISSCCGVTWVLIALCSLAAWPSAAGAQDKVTLRLNLSNGQVWTFDRTVDMAMNEQASNGVQQRNASTETLQHLTGKCEVLSAQNGLPTQTRINIVNNRDGKTVTNGQFLCRPAFPLFGQQGWVSNDFTGQLDAQTQARIQTNLDPDISIYPDHAIAVGDEWKGNPQAVAKQFNIQFPNETAAVTMKFISMQQVGGRSVAEISMSATAELHSMANKNETGMPVPGDGAWTLIESPGIKTQIKMQGTSLIDVRTGIPLKTTIKGTVTVNGVFQTVQVKDAGTMDVSSSATLAADPNGAALAPAPAINGGGIPVPVPGAANASNWAGIYGDGNLTLNLQGAGPFSGTITRGQQTFQATAAVKNGQLEGSFQSGDQSFPFTATLSGGTLTFKTGQKTYMLKRQAGNPLG